MFKYVGDISEVAHYIIENFIDNKETAVDATLGNGHDTDFLSERFDKVYAFDIQQCACTKYKDKNKENVFVINDSHENLNKYIKENIDCIIYNLGFLPGGNKQITTMHESSLKSIEKGIALLNEGGIAAICIYRGHAEGKIEEKNIIEYVQELPKNKYGVMCHEFINRSKDAPLLVVIEKKS
ncbi:class I SAM-dependent methyltransferase [uncultured Clostridium sp.]|uniref:tRNA (mnm(5)s(2)U34)-methyltransferase n=1 Tax=uncultured Clostridium sp. TaxID=59620 RepID=UPI0025ED2D24|nr:class I SAM-dependent methyltransferase [uncultured Clostridium sp.]